MKSILLFLGFCFIGCAFAASVSSSDDNRRNNNNNNFRGLSSSQPANSDNNSNPFSGGSHHHGNHHGGSNWGSQQGGSSEPADIGGLGMAIFGQMFPRCSNWSEPQDSKCFWPANMAYTDLPSNCRYMPVPNDLPAAMKKFILGKQSEEFDEMAYELKNRGASAPCGMCARKLRCQIRTNQTTDPSFCGRERVRYIRDSSCDVSAPCVLTLDKGVCSAPEHFSSKFQVLTSSSDFQKRRHKRASHQSIFDILSPQQPAASGDSSGNPEIVGDGTTNPMDGGFGGSDDNSNNNSDPTSPGGMDFGASNFTAMLKNIIGDNIARSFNNTESVTAPVWNCVKNKDGSKCLCCCDFFVPDPDTGKCVDTTAAMQTYVEKKAEDALDASMVIGQ